MFKGLPFIGKMNEFLGRMIHPTVQKIGASRAALDVVHKGYYILNPVPTTAFIVEAGSTDNLVNLTAHGFKPGDLFRIQNTANPINEFEIVVDEIVDANSFKLAGYLSANLTAGDTFFALRPVSERFSPDGATLASISMPAISYNRLVGGVTTQTSVLEDKDTPANTRALPVVIHGLDAANITVTANQLDVSLSHLDDSVKIGNGTNLLAINTNLEALVHDTDLITKISDGLQKSQIMSGAKGTSVSGLITSTPVDANHEGLDVVVSKELPAGTQIIGKVGIDPLVNTIKLDTANNLVKDQAIYNLVSPTVLDGAQIQLQADVNGKLIVKIPDAITVNTITGFATSAKQSDGTQLSQIAGIAKGVTPANSATVTVIGTDNNALDVNITKSVVVQTVPMLADGLTTLTNSSILNNAQYVTTLSNKLTQDVSAISIGWDSVGAHHREIAVDSTGQVKVLSAQLPTALGQVAMASSVSVAIASNQTAIPTVPSTQTGGVYTAQLAVGLTQVRATVSGAAPVSTRKKLFIKPSSLNTGAIFLIATGGSITTGLEIIGPDRLEFNLDAADYFVISDTAGQKVEVLEVY